MRERREWVWRDRTKIRSSLKLSSPVLGWTWQNVIATPLWLFFLEFINQKKWHGDNKYRHTPETTSRFCLYLNISFTWGDFCMSKTRSILKSLSFWNMLFRHRKLPPYGWQGTAKSTRIHTQTHTHTQRWHILLLFAACMFIVHMHSWQAYAVYTIAYLHRAIPVR